MDSSFLQYIVHLFCVKVDMQAFSIRWTSDTEHVTKETRNVMWGAVDAIYAACPLTRRSHGGWLVYLNGGAILWKSGLQLMITLSSCEAEFAALCSIILEVCY